MIELREIGGALPNYVITFYVIMFILYLKLLLIFLSNSKECRAIEKIYRSIKNKTIKYNGDISCEHETELIKKSTSLKIVKEFIFYSGIKTESCSLFEKSYFFLRLTRSVDYQLWRIRATVLFSIIAVFYVVLAWMNDLADIFGIESKHEINFKIFISGINEMFLLIGLPLITFMLSSLFIYLYFKKRYQFLINDINCLSCQNHLSETI